MLSNWSPRQYQIDYHGNIKPITTSISNRSPRQYQTGRHHNIKPIITTISNRSPRQYQTGRHHNIKPIITTISNRSPRQNWLTHVKLEKFGVDVALKVSTSKKRSSLPHLQSFPRAQNSTSWAAGCTNLLYTPAFFRSISSR